VIGAALSFVSFFVAVDKESGSTVGSDTHYTNVKHNNKAD